MTLVVDASVTLAWFFKDERDAKVDALLTRAAASGMHVPAHWALEIANGFRIAIRRGRFDQASRQESILQLERMPIVVDVETSEHAWHATLRLADAFELTPYDAAYLELAQRLRVPLATNDAALRKAALAAAVELA